MLDKKAEIFKAGRELFFTKGFKETNISDIAKLAGIGVGTFYNYYASKEQLFLEIYIKENENQKKRMFETMDFSEDPVTMITKMVTKNIYDMNSNLILKEWYNKELFGKLEKYFYNQGSLGTFDELVHGGMTELIKKWKAEGKMRNDLDDEMIMAIFNSIFYIDIHKSEIGLQYFPKIMYLITEFILKGLAVSP